MAEGRMALDPTRQLWAGRASERGSTPATARPICACIAMIGYHAHRRFRRDRARAPHEDDSRSDRATKGADTDHDGIPDDVDLCPSGPEDKLEPDPQRWLPKAADNDNDGIPDSADKCPDSPEDKDGIQDMDGCPEVDFDNDGVPDVTRRVPARARHASPDPKANGCPQFIKRVTGSTEIEILKQIQFDTGKATIKAAASRSSTRS